MPLILALHPRVRPIESRNFVETKFMNRTALLAIAAIFLALLAYFVVREDSTPATLSDASDDRGFAYKNIDEVHKIFIADRNGNDVTLTRGGVTGWLADGKPANANVMVNLLRTIEGLEVQSLPSYKAVPNLVKNIATQGILVQLFDEDGEKLHGMYIGGGDKEETGVYAILEDAENPYVVHLPHFTGNVRERFNLRGDQWRDKVYFRVDPEKVERFSIEYPKQQSQSFILERDGEGFTLRGMNEARPEKKLSFGQGERALARYEKYYVNRYENRDIKAQATAREVVPFAVIRMKQRDREEQTMEVYARYQVTEFIPESIPGAPGKYEEPSNYSAFVNNGEDWVLLSNNTFQPLLVGYDLFH